MSYLRRFLSLGELIMFSFRFSSRNVQYYILLYIIFIQHACFRQRTSSVIEFPFKGSRCVYYKMYKGNLLSQRAIENAWPINPSAKRTLRINAKIKTTKIARDRFISGAKSELIIFCFSHSKIESLCASESEQYVYFWWSSYQLFHYAPLCAAKFYVSF
mgnify:CR=1 FL=1